MRIALFENIMTPGGHEVDFDRIIVEELSALGHEVSFYVPEGFVFSFDYHVPVHSLPWNCTFFPQERSEATGNNSVTGNSRSSRTCNIFEPTRPVAPTTATIIS